MPRCRRAVLARSVVGTARLAEAVVVIGISVKFIAGVVIVSVPVVVIPITNPINELLRKGDTREEFVSPHIQVPVGHSESDSQHSEIG